MLLKSFWVKILLVMENCVFCKIVAGEIPAKIVYKDNIVVVFHDIKPLKSIHLLIIPKNHVSDFSETDKETLFAIKEKITSLVSEMNLKEKGYRIEVNGGTAMGVPHLHFHLLAPVGVAEKI